MQLSTTQQSHLNRVFRQYDKEVEGRNRQSVKDSLFYIRDAYRYYERTGSWPEGIADVTPERGIIRQGDQLQRPTAPEVDSTPAQPQRKKGKKGKTPEPLVTQQQVATEEPQSAESKWDGSSRRMLMNSGYHPGYLAQIAFEGGDILFGMKDPENFKYKGFTRTRGYLSGELGAGALVGVAAYAWSEARLRKFDREMAAKARAAKDEGTANYIEAGAAARMGGTLVQLLDS